MTDLASAIGDHYKAVNEAQRKRAEDEIRKFKPDPALDAAVERLDAQLAAEPGTRFGSFASSVENYRRRRDAAAALAARDALDNRPTGDDAA